MSQHETGYSLDNDSVWAACTCGWLGPRRTSWALIDSDNAAHLHRLRKVS